MRIAVLGTGTVGRTVAARLAELGHDVAMGTRDPAATRERSDPDGSVSFAPWSSAHPDVDLLAYADAGAHAEVVVNATAGAASLGALDAVGVPRLAGKVLLDLANPLDFSGGMPPTLTVANTDSLGEQIQRAHPDARVVKSLNTVNAAVMMTPGRLSGDHDVFVAGDDEQAKAVVTGLLGQIGWPAERVIDLGGIRAARGMEAYLLLWLALYGAIGSPDYNIRVVRA